MSLGEAWTETTPGSASKLNKVTVISGSGTYIVGLDKDNHILFRADTSTGGLTQDHLYMCSADGLSLIDLSDVDAHVHDSSASGGELFDIFRSNPNIIDTGFTLIAKPDKANWGNITTGTASIANDIDGTDTAYSIKLSTGGTSGSFSSIHQPTGLQMDISTRSCFKALMKIGTASSLAFRMGPGQQLLSDVDANNRKYGADVCTATSNNWFVRSGTGSASSASDTGSSAMVSRRETIRM